MIQKNPTAYSNIDQLMEPISKDEFRGAVRANIKAWEKWAQEMHTSKSQAYTILTMCRALYSLKYGGQVSKKQAVLCAAKEFPEWASLIEQAIVWRVVWKDEQSDHEETFEVTLRFVHFMINQSLKIAKKSFLT